ncbi:Piwi domain-containing protein [Glomus cerebriforme]|uniref:Piwi domain-containing protein n=1 Tax=Glomus cerebriforme TaxID=658196 RepID=A0A397T6U4_9GLOM|nr:Piwi domain-containing protein [Glomus cerebriforme]
MAGITNFVKRPGLGRQGRLIKIKTNYFEVKFLPNFDIYHYDIIIIPEVPPSLNRKIFQTAAERTSYFGGISPVFDGRRNIYTANPLPFDNVTTFDVTIPEDNGVSAGRRPPRSFKIIIRKVDIINMEELQRFLDGRCPISNNIITGIMAFNVLINNKPSILYNKIGDSFYINQDSQPLYGGIEAWQGYFQSIRPTPGKMMINIDLRTTFFYESGNLVQLIAKILNRKSVKDLKISDRDHIKLEKFLKNLKIYTTSLGSRRRMKITKLTKTSASNTKFDIDGQQIDIASYFQNIYNLSLQYPFLPCVVARNKTFLPMELCNVVNGQHYMHKLNNKQTADSLKFTCKPPSARANKIEKGPNILNYRNNEHMQQFGLRISNECAVVQARILPAPELHYHPSSRNASFVPNNGSWNLRDKKVATGATLGSWACAVFGSERNYPMRAVQLFLRELITTCQDTGMNIPNKTPPILHCNHQGDIERSLRYAWIRAGNLAKLQPQLILCILPDIRVRLYVEIKRVSDTMIGVATQCIQGKHMFAAKKQYCANVCLKINAKLGGMNSFINPSQIPFITERPTVLMGASVIHPALCDDRPSIAALCASMDAKAFRYTASIRFQTSRQEVIADLAGMVKEQLKTFYMTCGRKPERVLFYRNGISEGQFNIVLEEEIKAIKNACQSLDITYRPTITFVVVQKHHHTRFFPIDNKDSDRTGNCFPGTVVETTITHPFEFDFYLQSHSGLQGTSRPTHYHVLLDENGFNPDSLQTLTYNLCYTYARCTRAVSIVPPVYYAHLVCSRARFHATGENWSDTDSTSEGPNYAVIKPELLRVMYFI